MMKSRNETTNKQVSPKERILLTAHDLFYKNGIRATGIDRVIAESEVAKVTFYRYFPSKNDLIRAFLVYRHERWITWFADALQRHGGRIQALVPALQEWFSDEEFRGCAFINTLEELGGELPEVIEISRWHKANMTDIIADLLPPSSRRKQIAQALSMAVDGAIIRAQIDQTPDAALSSIDNIQRALLSIRNVGAD